MDVLRHHVLVRPSYLLLLLVCSSFFHTQGRLGGMRLKTGFENVDHFRVVECYVDTSMLSFVGLTMYRLQTESEILVSLKYRAKECKTYAKLAYCDFGEEELTTASVKVVLTDLKEGETRYYGCNASYFEMGKKTETYSINVTLPYPETTLATSPFKSTKGPATSEFSSDQPYTSTTDTWNGTTETPTTRVLLNDDDTVDSQAFDVSSLATGASVSLAFVFIVMTVWASCRRRCGLCRWGQLRSNRPGEAQRERQHMELPPIPRAELPRGAAEANYGDASASDYLSPVYKPSHPTDPPQRHVFRRPEGSDSASPYDIVP